MKFEGRSALITGAGGGIGRATAILLAQQGADVVATDLDLSEAEETVAAVEEIGRRAVAIAADLSKPTELYAMVDRATAAFAGVDGETQVHDKGHLTALDHPAVKAVAEKYPGRPGLDPLPRSF